MRVCKHGCDVKMFCFSRANHASANLKKFSSPKTTSLLEALGEFSTVMQTLDFVSGLHNCLKFSQPLSCLYQAMQTRKTFSIA